MATVTDRPNPGVRYTNDAAFAALILATATVLTSSLALLFAALLSAALAMAGAAREGVLRFSRVELGFMVLTLIASLSFTTGLVQQPALEGMVYWLAGLLVFYAARILTQQLGDTSWALTSYKVGLLACGDIIAVLSIFGKLTSQGDISFEAASAVIVVIPVALLVTWEGLREYTQQRNAERAAANPLLLVFALVSLVVMVGALFPVGLRGILLALGLALLLSPLLVRRSWAIGVLIGVLFAATLVIANFGLSWAMPNRDNLEAVTVERLNIWHSAALSLQDAPFTGIGFGSFPLVGSAQYTFIYTQVGGTPHTHNLYLQLALDLGLPGAILLLYVLALVCAQGVRFVVAARQNMTQESWLVAAALVGMAAYFLYGIVSSVTYDSLPALVVWLTLGFIAGMARLGPARTIANKRPILGRLALLGAGMAVALLLGLGLTYATIPTPGVVGEAMWRNSVATSEHQMVGLAVMPPANSGWWVSQVAGFSGADNKAEMATALTASLGGGGGDLASTHGLEGDVALAQGNQAAAVAQFRSSPDWLPVLLGRGDYLYASSKYAASLNVFQVAEQAYGQRAEIKYGQGLAEEKLGNDSAAAQAFTAAKTLPGTLDRLERSSLYRHMGDFYLYGANKDAAAADGEYSAGIGSYPTLELQLRDAEALLALKRFDDAAARTQQAIAAYPGDPTAFAELGRIYEQQGRCSDAVTAYKQALALGSQDPDVSRRLANPTCGKLPHRLSPHDQPQKNTPCVGIIGARSIYYAIKLVAQGGESNEA